MEYSLADWGTKFEFGGGFRAQTIKTATFELK
jgi:hypothetical protein